MLGLLAPAPGCSGLFVQPRLVRKCLSGCHHDSELLPFYIQLIGVDTESHFGWSCLRHPRDVSPLGWVGGGGQTAFQTFVMLSWLLAMERASICASPTLTPRVTGQHISVSGRRRERLEQRADILEI